MRSALVFLLWLGLLGALAGLAGGFAGALHPAGDSLAVFRLVFGALAAALALALGLLGSRFAWAGLVLVLLASVPTALSYRPQQVSVPVDAPAIYQKNLYFRNDDPEGTASEIIRSGAAIVTLQEVSAQNRQILDLVADGYPTVAYCEFNAIGGTVVLSRWPRTEDELICHARGGLTAVRLETPVGPVWAVSIHLHWPWPYGQNAHVATLLPLLGTLEGPVVIGGDFNMVPWGHSVLAFEQATRTMRAGPTVTTLVRAGRFAYLPIDHVLLPEGWQGMLELRPELGSDHRGVLVRFTP